MSVLLGEQLNYLNDFRIDTSADTVDVNVEGIRALNHIVRELDALHPWEFTIKKILLRYYNGVRTYAAPSNYRDMIGLYELQNYLDPFRRVKPLTFQRLMNLSTGLDLIADEFVNNVSVLHVNFVNSKSRSTTFLANTSFNGNGTWVASGGAASVATDTLTYLENTGAVRFNLGATGGTITNNDMTAVDLSSYGTDYGKFMKIFLPSASITSVQYRWGSSDSNYHAITATTQFDGSPLRAGINILGFLKQNATDTGTPDDSALDYAQLIFVTTAAMTGVRVSEIFAASADLLELEHYSSDWVYDNSAAAYVAAFPSDADTNDYGAWSGRYDWFANVVNVGAAAILLSEMEESATSTKYRRMYIGEYDSKGAVGGLVRSAIDRLPSRIKKPEPPMLVTETNYMQDYFAQP